MADELTLSCPFGTIPEDRWFRNAYKWDRVEIFEWLKAVSEGTKGGPSAEDPKIRPLLADAYLRIRRLCLEVGDDADGQRGIEFRDGERKPDNHIRRYLNTKWDRTNLTSKFTVGTVNATDYGPGGVKLTLPYWSPYDLLGYFLGLLGPAPQEATKETYFLPLTAVYGIWCSKIAGHAPKRFKWKPPGKGSGDWPYMFQCTWYKEKDKASRIAFRLGSCMGGDEFNENQVGSWRHTVGVRRFRILLSARLRIIMAEEEKNFPSPANYRAMERNANGTTTAYGNCAETYPFRGLMDSCPVTNLSNLHGLALQRDFIQTSRNNPAYDDSEDGVVWKRIRGPCGNCRVLLQRAGAKLTNFEDLEPENAPQNSPAMEKGDGASASVPGENVSAVAAGRKSSSGDENGYIN